jgi:hypothetical protein
MQQLTEVVGEESQLNLVFMYVVKNADVFANDGNGLILHGFIEELRVFYINEVVV